ncbi:MAG TPA: hypothetical protein VLF62_00105 [Candidatus Saccharimonadales bacterium]|nr:hypothetical protein [Candidatus Saccharimonadales bacterium]
MLQGEYLPALQPPQVRFTGDPNTMRLLDDGLTVMLAASTSAEMGAQPFVCTPDEASQARMEWTGALRRHDPEIRLVTPRTAELAYRGLVRAHANIEEHAATHGAFGSNDRKYAMGRAITDLSDLRAHLAEAGHFPQPEPNAS